MKKLFKPIEKDNLFRIHFHEDEAKLSWLPLLLDAYAVIDMGIRTAIKQEIKKNNGSLACRENCCNCCRFQTDIAIYPMELVGIYWYCIEKIQKPFRDILKTNLLSHSKQPPCPFLIDNSCSIYYVRPVACRQFNVFGNPCAAGEDPFHTRRKDVLTPIQDYIDRAFYIMLPFYGVRKESDKKQALKNNLIHTKVQNLQECNWRILAKRMEDFDAHVSEA